MRSQGEGDILKKVLAGMLLISVAGCSEPLTTREKGALVGAGIGAGTGALLGKGKGAAIGGAAGALGGAIVGDQMQRRGRNSSSAITVTPTLKYDPPGHSKRCGGNVGLPPRPPASMCAWSFHGQRAAGSVSRTSTNGGRRWSTKS